MTAGSLPDSPILADNAKEMAPRLTLYSQRRAIIGSTFVARRAGM
jgi:hypothetical protein